MAGAVAGLIISVIFAIAPIAGSTYVVEFRNEAKACDQEETSMDYGGTGFVCCVPTTRILPSSEKPNAYDVQADGLFDESIGRRCAYLIDDWWSYEFCHNKHVRQFHKEGAITTASFILGVFDPAGITTVHKQKSFDGLQDRTYVKQRYIQGSACDIAQSNRTVEVHFYCDMHVFNAITSLQETASCHYVAEVSSSAVCAHPAFQEPPAPIDKIMCFPSDTKNHSYA